MAAERDIPAILAAFSLSQAQRAAALARQCDVAVTAGAGTGKTRTLVARYLSLLDDGTPLRRIAAMTFTRKAAREMRNRVRSEIDEYLTQNRLTQEETQRWQTIYNELDAARIGTIHNLCADILRAHPAEAAVDPQFTVLDETQAALLAQEAIESTLAWAVEEAPLTPIFRLFSERSLQQLLALILSKRISVAEVMRDIAPEKIREHWQMKLQINRDRLIDQLLADEALRAARQLLIRSQAGNPEDKAEVQRQAAVNALNGLYEAGSNDNLHYLKALDGINLSGGSQGNWLGGKEELDEVKSALKNVRQMVRDRPLLSLSINEQDEAIAEVMPAIYAAAGQVQESYKSLKMEREGLDFDDLELLAIDLLEKHEAVRSYWQSQVAEMLVDEFQDTNEHQRRFIRLLCPGGDRLFIVGDGKQSIYRFRGADVAVFAVEKDDIDRRGGQLIDLDVSYRAHEALLTGMNQLLKPILGEDWPGRPSWIAPFAALEPGTKQVDPNLAPPFVELQIAVGNKGAALPHAADALAERLSFLHVQSGIAYGEMAILCRASNAFQFYEDALDRAGIPYLTVAGKGFYDRPEIRDLLNALQAVADPHDDLAVVGLLRSPACGLSDVTLYQLSKRQQGDQSLWDSLLKGESLEDDEENGRMQTAVALIRDLNHQAGRLPVAAILAQFLEKTSYRAFLRRAGELRALRNVTKLLVDVHDSQLVSVAALLEYVRLLRESGSREGEARALGGGAVQVMSIHAAKGLEFPLVVLGDAGSGTRSPNGTIIDGDLGILLSNKNQEGDRAASYELGLVQAKEQEQAESDRLLYVALTRAEQMLLINGTVRQNQSGQVIWDGWLGDLAEICGLKEADLSAYDELGAGRQDYDLRIEQTAVRASFFEPGYRFEVMEPEDKISETVQSLAVVTPLQDPVYREEGYDTAAGNGARARLNNEILFGQSDNMDQIMGLVVHDALAAWRFPGPGFDEWVKGRIAGYRLGTEAKVQKVVHASSQMLARLQAHPLGQEMAAAKRRLHEVPYTVERDGWMDNGRMDMLFENKLGWTVVDFKSGYIGSEAGFQRLLNEKGATKRLQQYGTAVQELLADRPRLILCHLNYLGGIRLHEVKIFT